MAQDNPQPAPIRFGGSMAPAINENMLAEYRAAIEEAPVQIRETLRGLAGMVERFMSKEPSTLPGKLHASGRGMIVSLTKETIDDMWEFVPWQHELDAYKKFINEGMQIGAREVVQNVPAPQGPKNPDGTRTMQKTVLEVTDEKAWKLWNATWHLIWYAQELTLDREPMTNERFHG